MPTPTHAVPLQKRLRLGNGFVARKIETGVGTQARDRFVMPRIDSSARDIFFMSSPVAKLSPRERLVRQRNPSTDAFSNRPPSYSHLLEQRYIPPVDEDRVHSLFRADGVLNARSLTSVEFNRDASTGIYNVGGSFAAATAGAAITDGHGGYLGVGSNAPIFVSRFLEGPTPTLEVYGKRLALAMGIDQTNKVLGHRDSAVSPSLDTPGKFEWRDNSWMREGYVKSKQFVCDQVCID